MNDGPSAYEIARQSLRQARAYIPRDADQRRLNHQAIEQIEMWMRRHHFDVPRR